MSAEISGLKKVNEAIASGNSEKFYAVASAELEGFLQEHVAQSRNEEGLEMVRVIAKHAAREDVRKYDLAVKALEHVVVNSEKDRNQETVGLIKGLAERSFDSAIAVIKNGYRGGNANSVEVASEALVEIAKDICGKSGNEVKAKAIGKLLWDDVYKKDPTKEEGKTVAEKIANIWADAGKFPEDIVHLVDLVSNSGDVHRDTALTKALEKIADEYPEEALEGIKSVMEGSENKGVVARLQEIRDEIYKQNPELKEEAEQEAERIKEVKEVVKKADLPAEAVLKKNGLVEVEERLAENRAKLEALQAEAYSTGSKVCAGGIINEIRDMIVKSCHSEVIDMVADGGLMIADRWAEADKFPEQAAEMISNVILKADGPRFEGKIYNVLEKLSKTAPEVLPDIIEELREGRGISDEFVKKLDGLESSLSGGGAVGGGAGGGLGGESASSQVNEIKGSNTVFRKAVGLAENGPFK